jgi:PAS domain S-box-containing protein
MRQANGATEKIMSRDATASGEATPTSAPGAASPSVPIAALPWAACVVGAGGTVLGANRAWAAESHAGETILAWCERSAVPLAETLLAQILSGELPEAICRQASTQGTPGLQLHLHGIAPGRALALLERSLDSSRVEADLRDSEVRFRELTEISSDWYWETDKELRFRAVIFSSQRGGARSEDAIGKRRWELPNEPVGFTWEEHIAEHQARRPYTGLVFRHFDLQGNRHYWRISGRPAFDAAGRFTGYRGVGTDITERHRWDALRAAEARLYESLLRDASLDELMAALCTDVEAVLYRPGWVTVQEIRGGRLYLLAAPHMPAGYLEAYAAGIAVAKSGSGSCGAAAALNATVISPEMGTDPHWAPFHDLLREIGLSGGCWSTPLRGAAGGVIGAFAVFHPRIGAPEPKDLEIVRHASQLAALVIERVRARGALAESEQRFRGVVELTHDGLMIHDQSGIRYANPALARMLGAPSAASMAGADPYTWIALQDQARMQARRDAVLAGNVSAPFMEVRMRGFDGRELDIEAAGTPIEIDGRHMVLTQMRDVSARKRHEREILRLNESLEQAVAERTRELSAAISELESFSYMVAHDLRAPLRAIDGYASLLPGDAGVPLGPDAQRDLDAIRRSAQHMGQLIDGLLRFSQASRVELARSRLPTADMVAAILAEQGARQHARISIGDLPDLTGDPLLLHQVLVNLIGNAVKYSARNPAPAIEISGQQLGGETVITIKDNGVGFDPAYAGKLFGIFQRLHGSGDFEGVGVGLAIVRRIVERHGGRVWAESSPGKGASFSFSVPAAARA